MQSLTILFALFGASMAFSVHTENVTPRVYENQLNKTMFCVRDLLNTGKPEIGLPSFDPLVLKDINIDFDQFGLSFLKGKITIEKITFYDAVKFYLSLIEGTHVQNPDALQFRVITEWPVSSFEGQYDINVSAFGNTIKGKGTVKETITDYGSDIKFKASLPLKLHEFNIRVFMEGFEFHASEVIFNGENVTDELNRKANMGVKWLKENTDVVDKLVSNIVMEIVNGIHGNKYDGGAIIAEIVNCWNNAA